MEGLFVLEPLKDLVKSAVEMIGSRLLSCIFDQWEENESRDANMREFKKEVYELKALLEDKSGLSLTNTGHCLQWKDFKEDMKKWMAQLEPDVGMEQKCFTSKDVKTVKKVLGEAKEFLEVVGKSSISNNPCHVPLVALLLEGKSILYERTTQGESETARCWIRPVDMTREDRGFEAALRYMYSDQSRPGKDFAIELFLRISKGTDIVEVATTCLRKALPSQLKQLHYQSAVRELQQLASSQDIKSSPAAPRNYAFEIEYTESTSKARPAPFCCSGKAGGSRANRTLVDISDMLPEEVVLFDFSCFAGAAPNSNVGSTSSGASRNRTMPEAARMVPLEVSLGFVPHAIFRVHREIEVLEETGERRTCKPVRSLQEFLQIAGSNATECFARQPQLIKYTALWCRKRHGAARIVVRKSKFLEAMCTFEAVVIQQADDPKVAKRSRRIMELLSRARGDGAPARRLC